MISFKLKCAVLAAVGVLSTQAFAAWEALPTAGFAVAGTGAGTHQPTGGTTAYKICNPTGNYGATSSGFNPKATCTSPVWPGNILTSPEAGFTIVTSANRAVIMNNALTGNVNKQVGTLVDVVFRNAAKTECIYGTQTSLSTEIQPNGIARGGFSASGTVNASYSINPGAWANPVFRVGRTFTSVQHLPVSGASFTPGYYNLPLINPPYNLAINAGTAVGKQSASINANWVEFTTLINHAASPMVYVKAACTAAAPVAVSDAIRLRQTRGGSLFEVRVPGFVPPGGNALPAPINPY